MCVFGWLAGMDYRKCKRRFSAVSCLENGTAQLEISLWVYPQLCAFYVTKCTWLTRPHVLAAGQACSYQSTSFEGLLLVWSLPPSLLLGCSQKENISSAWSLPSLLLFSAAWPFDVCGSWRCCPERPEGWVPPCDQWWAKRCPICVPLAYPRLGWASNAVATWLTPFQLYSRTFSDISDNLCAAFWLSCWLGTP